MSRDQIIKGDARGLADLRRLAAVVGDSPKEASSAAHPVRPGSRRRGRPATGRQRRNLSLPESLIEQYSAWQRQREDLVTQALMRLNDDLFDRQVPRPLYPEPRRPVSFSLTPATWDRIDRVAAANAWTASATITTLLHHHEHAMNGPADTPA